MQFVHPQFLWALTFLAVPIIIHLFSFKKARRVEFSNVEFLKQLKEQSRSRRRIKDWILLLLRCLTIALVVLAFARPYIPTDDGTQGEPQKVVGIYLDNSMSMEVKGERGRTLDRAKEVIGGILDKLPPQAKVIYVTAELKGQDMHARSPEEARRALVDTELGLRSTTVDDGISTLVETAGSYGLELDRAFVFSDFQRGQVEDLDQMDDGTPLTLVPFTPARKKNYFIDTAWFDDPVQKKGVSSELFFRVNNESDEIAEEVMITLELNGKVVGKTFVSLPSDGATVASIGITSKNPGIQRATLSLEDGTVFFDDEFNITWEVASSISVAISGAGGISDSLGMVFALDTLYKSLNTPGTNLTPEQIRSADVLALSGAEGLAEGTFQSALNRIRTGGVVILMASKDQQELLRNALTMAEAGRVGSMREGSFQAGELKTEMPFYQGVFDTKPERVHQPTFSYSYPLNLTSARNTHVLWELQDGSPLLIEKRHGAGYVFALLADPSNGSNFMRHALFPTLSLRMGEHGRTKGRLFMNSGSPSVIELDPKSVENVESLELISDQGEVVSTLPIDQSSDAVQVRLSGLEELPQIPGFYSLVTKGRAVASLAIDHDPVESRQDFLDQGEVKQWAKGGTEAKVEVSPDHAGLEADLLDLDREYWRLLLFLALISLATEMTLSRLFFR